MTSDKLNCFLLFHTFKPQTRFHTVGEEMTWKGSRLYSRNYSMHFSICPSWSSLLQKGVVTQRFSPFWSVTWRPKYGPSRNLLRLQFAEANVYMDTILAGVDLQVFNHDIGKSMTSSFPPSKFFCFKPEILQPSSRLATGGCSEDVRLFAYWHDLKGILPICRKIKQNTANERWYFMWYVKQERPCFITFPNIERRVENTTRTHFLSALTCLEMG